MKNTFFLTIILLFSCSLFSQDLIETSKGTTFCKIIKVDSLYIQYTTTFVKEPVSISLTQVIKYQYNFYEKYPTYPNIKGIGINYGIQVSDISIVGEKKLSVGKSALSIGYTFSLNKDSIKLHEKKSHLYLSNTLMFSGFKNDKAFNSTYLFEIGVLFWNIVSVGMVGGYKKYRFNKFKYIKQPDNTIIEETYKPDNFMFLANLSFGDFFGKQKKHYGGVKLLFGKETEFKQRDLIGSPSGVLIISSNFVYRL